MFVLSLIIVNKDRILVGTYGLLWLKTINLGLKKSEVSKDFFNYLKYIRNELFIKYNFKKTLVIVFFCKKSKLVLKNIFAFFSDFVIRKLSFLKKKLIYWKIDTH